MVGRGHGGRVDDGGDHDGAVGGRGLEVEGGTGRVEVAQDSALDSVRAESRERERKNKVSKIDIQFHV